MAELDREHWERRFSTPDYLFGTEPNSFLKSQARRLKVGQTALAIADGEGRNGVWLAELGLHVHAVDISPTALAKARALAERRGVSLRTEQADLQHWPWPREAYDTILAIFIQFAGPTLREGIFAGIEQALKPGGLLLMQGYRPEQLNYRTGGPPYIDYLYTRPMLEAAFADLTELKIHEHDSVVNEGTAHLGMSALVDLVGVK
jgi:cyclopropane fatty-acyl-phospholipid synthase-like methyltransferase